VIRMARGVLNENLICICGREYLNRPTSLTRVSV
jgi:hypothetical protein